MLKKIKVMLFGLNLNCVINEIVKNGINIYDLQIKRNKIAFFTKYEYISKVELICKKYHKNYKIIQINPIKRLFSFIPKCFGFVMAMVVSLSFLLSYNMYVFDVKVSCDSAQNFDLESIRNTLKKDGIISGMNRKNVSVEKIQKLIISSHENISGCLVKNNGGIIDIVVYPSAQKDEIKSDNLYSKYNAKIKSVEVFSGIAKVKAGDVVQVGDMLIENNNGASGKIVAEVLFEDYLIYNENQTIEKFTGRTETKQYLLVFNKKLFKPSEKIDFINYKEENCVFYISKNMFLPIGFNRVIYKETCLEDTVIPFSVKEEELKNSLKNELLKKIDDSFVINNISYSVVTEENLTRLDCFVSVDLNLAD